MHDLRLYDYPASANCYKVRLLLAQLERSYEREMERWPAVQAWLERVAAQPRYRNDLAPYPANARPAAGRSIYG